ncbi:MAG TPA: metalloregulator ArsR/SmtB family transcription factor [Anaerolineales bacterium]|nr:metalloregulator ArsR/SmtB family transcription factor [Anaerolineales bacterium]
MKATLEALAEPNRLRIVELLRGGPRPVNEIVEKLALPQPLVSKHLRALRKAGLVQAQPRAQQRVYQLQPAAFQELDSWISSFRRLWEHRLDALDDYMQELKSQRPARK